MEIAIVIAGVAVLGLIWYFNRGQKADINQDGRVDLADARAAVKNTVSGVARAADVNRDGKVNARDARAAASKAVGKAKTAVKKATGTASKKRNFAKKAKPKA